jgi:hypothetical protein
MTQIRNRNFRTRSGAHSTETFAVSTGLSCVPKFPREVTYVGVLYKDYFINAVYTSFIYWNRGSVQLPPDALLMLRSWHISHGDQKKMNYEDLSFNPPFILDARCLQMCLSFGNVQEDQRSTNLSPLTTGIAHNGRDNSTSPFRSTAETNTKQQQQ